MSTQICHLCSLVSLKSTASVQSTLEFEPTGILVRQLPNPLRSYLWQLYILLMLDVNRWRLKTHKVVFKWFTQERAKFCWSGILHSWISNSVDNVRGSENADLPQMLSLQHSRWSIALVHRLNPTWIFTSGDFHTRTHLSTAVPGL